jgi:hypothetical protein
VTETLHAAFPDRFVVSPKLRELVGSGKTAIYRPDLTLDPEVVAALAVGDRPSTEDQVRERALAGLAEEIQLMLGESVVAAPEDIDLCMIMGAGWPFHLGRITPTWTAPASPRRSTAPASAPPGSSYQGRLTCIGRLPQLVRFVVVCRVWCRAWGRA